MMDQKAYEICKERRAHVGMGSKYWELCQWCGMWYRQTVEEREDEPPETEQSPFAIARKNERDKSTDDNLDEIRKCIERLNKLEGKS